MFASLRLPICLCTPPPSPQLLGNLVSTHLFETWGRGDGGEFGWLEDGKTPMGGDSQIVALMYMGVYVCLFQ